MQEITRYGVKEFTQLESVVDGYVEEVRVNGFAILPDVLDPDMIKMLANKVDEISKQQVAEISNLGNLAEINDANIVRALLAYDEAFLDLAVQPFFLLLMQKLLGEYFILQMQNAIINLPNEKNYQVAWHRDLNYQHFTSSRPLAVSVLVCLDNFSPETGGTCVLPGTHKGELFHRKSLSKSTKKTLLPRQVRHLLWTQCFTIELATTVQMANVVESIMFIVCHLSNNK